MLTPIKLPTANLEILARLVVPVNILFVLLLAHSLARLSWNWLGPPAALAPAAVEQTTADTSAPAARDKSAQPTTIANWHLFGKVEVAKPVPVAPPQSQQAPETKLNLKLLGIFFSDNPEFALAIIADSSGPECPLRIGDPIRDNNCNPVPNGPRLEKILPDKVILSRNGNLETLSLPKESPGDAAKPNTPAASLLKPAARPPAVPGPPAAAASNAPQTIDASAVAERLRSQAAPGPEALQELFILTPYRQNNQFKGFSLQPGRDRNLFQQLKLQTGDIITQFNGTLLNDPLNDPSQGMMMLQTLLSADQVDLKVLRGGTELSLTFILRARNPTTSGVSP